MACRLGWLSWLALVAICIVWPSHALFGDGGPFSRQLVNSPPWKSLSECGLLLGLLYTSLRVRKGGIVLAIVATALYTRRHGVDITLVLLATYAAGIQALGRVVARMLRLNDPASLSIALRDMVFGLLAWSAMIWLISLAGFGSIAWIRGIGAVVLGASLSWESWLLRGKLAWPKWPVTRVGALTLATMVTSVAMLAAKAAASVDSDALWYGLNADRVLLGEGGLFDAQGLITHVHYYPKLAESLQIPFLSLGSASLVTGFSLICWLLLMATCRELLRGFGVGRRYAWLGALLACVVPAVAASAATPKGELLAAWLCVFGLLAAIQCRQGRASGWLGVGVAAVLLAPLARLTVLPYAVAIFGFLVIIGIRERARLIRIDTLVPLILSGIVVLLVCLRTWRMTGVALSSPDVVVTLQGWLGWHLHDDIGRYEPDFRTPFPGGLIDALFGPARYIHQALFWMGNAWLPLFLVAVARRGWTWLRDIDLAFTLALGLSMYALLYAYRYGNDGADGNYFIVPIVLITLVAWTGAFSAISDRRVERPLLWGSLAMLVFSLFMVLTTANWLPGVRRLDANFRRTPFGEIDTLAVARFKTSGLAPVADVLSAWPASTRVLGDATVGDGGYFPVRYESLGTIAWARPPLLADEAAIRSMLHDHAIGVVVLGENRDPAVEARVRPVLEHMAAEGMALHMNVSGTTDELWILPPAQSGLRAGNMAGRTWR